MLAGKLVLITGASSGIGRATALTLARAGSRVFAHGRNEAGLESLRAELGDACAGTMAVDLTSADDVPAQLVARATEALGGLTTLVHSAGTILPGAGLAAFDKNFGVNTRAGRLLVNVYGYIKHFILKNLYFFFGLFVCFFFVFFFVFLLFI